MMRRSKRQTKCNNNNNKSIDENDQVEQQQPAQTKLIQKKSKKILQQINQDEVQNNFQIASTNKRELDSVVVNLAAQLEKAQNALDAAESGRPKRVRKITEKAEQELLAKQIKAKTHKKKGIDGKSSHSDGHSESAKTLYSNNGQVIINNKSTHTRSRKSEIHNDEQEMDIENIRICDQKTENTLQFCQQANKHSLSQSDDEDHEDVSDLENSQEQDSVMDEEHQEDEESADDLEEEEEDEQEEEDEDDCEDSENEDNNQVCDEEQGEEEDSQVEDNEDKLSLKEANQDENILKASTKSNQQQLGDSNSLSKLNSKESNKIVKKRSSSLEKSNKNLNFDLLSNNTNNKFVDNNKTKDEKDTTENQNEQTKKLLSQSSAAQEINNSVPPIPLLKKKQNKKSKKQDQEDNLSEEKQQDEQEEKEQQQNEEEEDDEAEEEDESSSADEDEDNKNEEGGKGDGSNSSKAKKMPWSEEEDKLVIRLVEQHGPQKWTFIAQHIPGRIGKQCRERWHNHLNPKINKEPWGDDEEWVLFLCHKLKGNKWAEITQYLPGRTDNAIKNHWNSSMKKRIPELYQRFAFIKRGESPEYDITTQYKKFEDEILKQLLAMADEGVDQYFVQTTRRRRNNNNAVSSTPTNNNISLKGSKLKKSNENEDKNDEDEQELIQVPLAKKVSKAAMKAAAKQAALAEKQQQLLNEENQNNHFTPINNNKSSNNNFKNIPNSAAASTADVKEIIQRIPHNIKEFENFRKQIIQYSDEYYQHHHLLQQTPNDKESSLNLLSADKGMNTEVNLSDTKHLEKILETPLSVENYVQQNPIFADIVRSALKYSSCQKNLTFMSHVKKSNSNVLEASVNNDHNQLSATSTLLNTVQQDKSSIPNLDQSPDDDLLSSTKNGNEKLKKKRGRKPKQVKEPEITQHVPINVNNPPKNINTQNPNGVKKIMQGPPYMHPMYMMNPHHPHPYYANHPNHPGYYPPPPPPHMMAHMQGYPHPHHMQYPIPPPHMQHPHYRQMGHHGPPPPPHHQSMRGGQNGQGPMMMPPPPPPHHLQQMRMRHPGMGHPHHMYMGNNMMSQRSDSSENSNFQTPQKYQKTNQGDRSIFKSVTPIIPPNSDKQLKFEEKQNKQLKLNNFNNDDDYNNFMVNNSFSKENINPNIQNLALPSNKESNVAMGVSNAGNNMNNSTNSNSSGNSQSSCINNNNNNNNISAMNNNNINNSSNNNIIIQSQNHNFITPNKYETPSKLLDFDSEPRLNCNSVDKYFNMRNYSSNHKLNNLYANHVNNFQHSSNSAFKCYPHINMDYQDTPSAKKSSYC